MSVVVPVQDWFELDDWCGLWRMADLKARGCDDCDNEKALAGDSRSVAEAEAI